LSENDSARKKGFWARYRKDWDSSHSCSCCSSLIIFVTPAS
jgi:hypothetical protein